MSEPGMVLRDVRGEWTSFNGVRGRFGEITYFLTTLSLREAVEQLYLMPQTDLNFEERIQRMLNTNRVEKEILPYLKGGGQRFFNALAVVPIPDRSSTSAFWYDEVPSGEHGPVEKWATLNIRRNVACVVVDGQHRKRAVDLYWEAKSAGENLDEIDLPVAFLFFSNVGRVDGACPDRGEILTGTRRLFRDLNLTARKMDRYTTLLVDDAYLPGVMARQLLESDSELERLTKWSAGSGLTDDDPYMTTLGVITAAIEAYIGDRAVLAREFYDASERRRALRSHFEAHPRFDVSTRDFVTAAFRELDVFKSWKAVLIEADVCVPKQPVQSRRGRPSCALAKARQRRRVERQTSILYTVPGQRALFSAMTAAFATSSRTDRSALEELFRKVDKLEAQGAFDRTLAGSGRSDIHPLWRDILIGPTKSVLTSRRNWTAAGQVISYLLGTGTETCSQLETSVSKSIGARLELRALEKFRL